MTSLRIKTSGSAAISEVNAARRTIAQRDLAPMDLILRLTTPFFVLIYEYHNKMSNSFCLSLFLSFFYSSVRSFFSLFCVYFFPLFRSFSNSFTVFRFLFYVFFLFFILFFPTVHFLVLFFIDLTSDSSLA